MTEERDEVSPVTVTIGTDKPGRVQQCREVLESVLAGAPEHVIVIGVRQDGSLGLATSGNPHVLIAAYNEGYGMLVAQLRAILDLHEAETGQPN